MHKKILLLCGLILMLVLVACEEEIVPTPTFPPRPTATPLATALPDIPTAIPAGFNADNPIRLVIVPADLQAASDLVAELEAQLAARTGLALEVELASSQAEALQAVCFSTGRQVAIVWVDGLTLAGAMGQDCGVPILQIQRSTDDSSTPGEAGVLLFHSETVGEDATLDDVPENTFCRTTTDDLYSWIVPTMILHSAGYDISDLADVDERHDYDALVADVRTGTCVVIGLPESVWESYINDDPSLAETVRLGTTSVDIPYGVLVAPFAASLEAITQLTDVLLTLDILFGEAQATETPEAEAAEATPEATNAVSDESVLAGQLAVFFGEGVLLPAEISDFTEYTEFLIATGIDFGQLGR